MRVYYRVHFNFASFPTNPPLSQSNSYLPSLKGEQLIPSPSQGEIKRGYQRSEMQEVHTAIHP